MKIVDFYRYGTKSFSIRKFIKPTHSQEFFNSQHFQKIKDKKKLSNSSTDGAIFPFKPLHPDESKSQDFYDEKNENYMFHINKRTFELQERTDRHIAIAKASMVAKNKKKIFSNKNLSADELGVSNEISVDKETGLIHGVGFDHLISSSLASSKEETSDEKFQGANLNQLINKLGYLDFRDFVALNKYIIDASNHEDLVNQTKSKFLQIAMQKMNSYQKEELKKNFRKIDESNKDSKTKERNDLKIEFMLNNIEESKELFYNYYYKLKEMNEREEAKAMNEFEKYEQMAKSLQDSKTKSSDLDDTLGYNIDSNNKKYDLNDYMERIIKTYRDQRTISVKSDSETIINKLRFMTNKFASKPYITGNKLFNNAIILAKYQTFLNKYKKIYMPTNIETERLMNKYLREKRIKEFTKEKMMQEKDPYFSPLTDEDDTTKHDNINDEASKQLAMEKHKIKKNYFDAKYQYQLKELEKNVDKQLADELGVVLTKEATTKPLKDITEYDEIPYNSETDSEWKFIEDFVDEHYKSFKLDFMYNYMDFFSNKYKVRRRITEDLAGKSSLKEINYILNSLVEKETGSQAFNSKSKRYSVHDFIRSQLGEVNPTFVETLTENKTNNPIFDSEVQSSVKSAIKNADKKPIELDENDKFEVQLYKGIKNDPYFRHYLHNNFAYFSETMNDLVAGMPHMSRGHKHKDFVRYNSLPQLKKESLSESAVASLISEDKSEMVDSIQNNFNQLSTKVETQPTKEKTYYGMGKRKRAKAYVQVKAGKGKITINGRPFIEYFNNAYIRGKILTPLQITDTIAQLDLNIKVLGGGHTGQTEAIIPALSKALIQINPQWRPELAKFLCLTHDPRNVEAKKPGRIKARKGYVYNRR